MLNCTLGHTHKLLFALTQHSWLHETVLQQQTAGAPAELSVS